MAWAPTAITGVPTRFGLRPGWRSTCTVSGVVAAVLQRDSGQPRVHRLPAGSEAVDLVTAQAIAEGRSNQAICEALFLAPKTVRARSTRSSSSSACRTHPRTTARPRGPRVPTRHVGRQGLFKWADGPSPAGECCHRVPALALVSSAERGSRSTSTAAAERLTVSRDVSHRVGRLPCGSFYRWMPWAQLRMTCSAGSTCLRGGRAISDALTSAVVRSWAVMTHTSSSSAVQSRSVRTDS